MTVVPSNSWAEACLVSVVRVLVLMLWSKKGSSFILGLSFTKRPVTSPSFLLPRILKLEITFRIIHFSSDIFLRKVFQTQGGQEICVSMHTHNTHTIQQLSDRIGV